MGSELPNVLCRGRSGRKGRGGDPTKKKRRRLKRDNTRVDWK